MVVGYVSARCEQLGHYEDGRQKSGRLFQQRPGPAVALRVIIHRQCRRMQGICVAPNLWETDNTGDPMAALVLSQQLCKFVANCLEWRMTTTPPNDPAPAIPAGAVGGPPLNMAPPP